MRVGTLSICMATLDCNLLEYGVSKKTTNWLVVDDETPGDVARKDVGDKDGVAILEHLHYGCAG
jgi:hypothetical protein